MARSPADQIDDLILETGTVRGRLGAVLWLTATVAVVGPVGVAGPRVGLDPGWIAGLHLGRQAEMRHGRELIFTYGPWGFLDVPLAINRLDFVLGLAFSVASVVVVWLLLRSVLGSNVKPQLADPLASLLTITFSSVSSPSFLLTAAAALACIRHLRQPPLLSTAWCPVVVAGLAAFLLQVKFSEGVVVTAFAGVTSLASPRSRLIRTVGSAVTWLVTFSVLWVVGSQSVSDIGPWLRASIDLVTGYSSAMSMGSYASVVKVIWSVVVMLLIVFFLVHGTRRRAGGSVVSHAGSIVVTFGALFFGFKQTFTRHSVDNNAAFFVIAALLLCLLVERGTSWRATVILIGLSSLIAGPALSTYVRGNPSESWVSTWQILTSERSRKDVLDRARVEGQAGYVLSRAMVEATHGQAMSVDPWDVSLVWAYSLRWRPMPVFQSYAAYTAHLDQLNADFAKRANDDQLIIRATTVSAPKRPAFIDGRNPMWEAPRYTLTVVCNYSLVTSDKRWLLLRKSVNRCGGPSVPTIAHVSAREPVRVPNAAPDEIVVASFFPAKKDPLVAFSHFLLKDPEHLSASVDGKPFRLPDGLASGPLLTVLPATSGWPSEFRGQTSARSLSFNRAGKVHFRIIRLKG